MLAIGRQRLDRRFVDRHLLNRRCWLGALES